MHEAPAASAERLDQISTTKARLREGGEGYTFGKLKMRQATAKPDWGFGYRRVCDLNYLPPLQFPPIYGIASALPKDIRSVNMRPASGNIEWCPVSGKLNPEPVTRLGDSLKTLTFRCSAQEIRLPKFRFAEMLAVSPTSQMRCEIPASFILCIALK